MEARPLATAEENRSNAISKYDFIEEIIGETLVNKSSREERTDRIDRWLTGKYTGLPIFLLIMAMVFIDQCFAYDFFNKIIFLIN